MSRPAASGRPTRLLFVAAHPSIDRTYEVDRLVAGEIHRPLSVVAVPGGKGLNAARAAALLGGRVTAGTIVAGRSGDWIVERLASLGIDARIARSNGETRTCISVLDRSTGALTEIYERGDDIEPAAWTALEAIVRTELEVGDIAAIALSGSLPPAAPADGYGRIARMAGGGPRAVPILADTYGPALAAVLAERPAVVKVNAGEASGATGMPVHDAVSAIAAAVAMRRSGASCVIVTLGLDGAVIVTDDGSTRIVPPDLRGPYSVGSGDAFFGGLAVAFARGDSVVEAARLGQAAGIANARVPGAGELDPSTITSILERIGLSSI